MLLRTTASLVVLASLASCSGTELEPETVYVAPEVEVNRFPHALDLDGDGETDFTISQTSIGGPGTFLFKYYFNDYAAAASVLRWYDNLHLEEGDEVGPYPDDDYGGAAEPPAWSVLPAWLLDRVWREASEEETAGPLADEQSVYVGVRLEGEDGTRYGWVRLSARIEPSEVPVATAAMTVHEYALGAVGRPVRVGERP